MRNSTEVEVRRGQLALFVKVDKGSLEHRRGGARKCIRVLFYFNFVIVISVMRADQLTDMRAGDTIISPCLVSLRITSKLEIVVAVKDHSTCKNMTDRLHKNLIFKCPMILHSIALAICKLLELIDYFDLVEAPC